MRSHCIEHGRILPRWRWVGIVTALVIAFGCCGFLQAQVTSGTLTGAVTDPTGKAVPNCKITATNSATGATHKTQTGSTGLYNLPSLPPGPYTVSVSAPGFATETAKVSVLLDRTQRLNFALQLSRLTQTVEVTAGAQVLETESHQIGATLSSQTLENLPNVSRNLFDTLATAPNVKTYGRSNAHSDISFFQTGGNSLTIGGTAYGNTSYLQDGVTNYNLLTKTANFQPTPEAASQVSIQSNGASARYDGPSVVNVLTKSGSNHFHGTLYDYFQNDALNARSYFSNSKPELRYNQFGANLGGPILPNKLFFFFAYDGLRQRSAYTSLVRIPTMPERAGDFSGDPFTIYNPATYNSTTGTISPFPGNQIPKDHFSPVGTTYLGYFPQPNGIYTKGSNYQINLTPTTTYDDYLGRMDYNMGSKDLIYGAIEKANPTTNNPSWANPLFDALNIQLATNGYLQETHTFGPSLVNVARFGYNESNIFETERGAGKQDYTKIYNLPYVSPPASQQMPPVISLAGYSGFGNDYAPDGALQKLYQLSDEVNKVIGKHTLYFGAEANYIDFSASWTILNNGHLNFNGQYTSDHTANAAGGSSIADLLLGLPNQAQGGIGHTTGDFKMWYVMPYIQDDWKVTRNLTLNLGLRYDFYQAPNDSRGHSGVFIPATNTVRPGTFNQDYTDFAPRLGLAYSLNNRTVLRGGYGIYYSMFMFNEVQFLLAHPPNFTLQVNNFAINDPTTIDNVFKAPTGGSAMTPFTTGLDMPTPRIQQWNFAVQHAFRHDWSATIAYLGNKAVHLQQRFNANQATPPKNPTNPSPIATRRLYPGVGDVYEAGDIGWANYNGMQLKLSHRFANGFTLDANYVWSKAMDVNSGDNQNPRYGRNLGLDYGPADFDIAQEFKLSGVYTLPFGNASNWLIRNTIGGWQASGFLTWSTGIPFSVFARDLSNTGSERTAYADVACSDPYHVSNRSVSRWYNLSCFVQPGVGGLGNVGRNSLVGPNQFTLDISAAKNFPMTESSKLQFRADLRNILNHPVWGFPLYTQSVANPDSLGVASEIGSQRAIELSLKVLF